MNRCVLFTLDTGPIVYLGYDPDSLIGSPPTSRVPANWSSSVDGPWVRYTVDTFFFADPGTDDLEAARADAAAYLDAARTAMLFKPPLLKNLARGAGVIPNTYENRGTLETDNGRTLLADCFLESCSIVGDDGIHGVGVQFIFVAVAARGSP